MRMKLAGRDSYGKIPKVFLDNDIVKMEFDIHEFANLPQKEDEYFYTGTIKAHGHFWKLDICPRIYLPSNNDVESVTIGLVYDGENTQTDPVVAKGSIRTKTKNVEIPKHEFSKGLNNNITCYNFATREDIIENDCNDAGTLTITVELEVATEKRSVWYPQLTQYCDTTNIGSHLYNSPETSDITFIIGASKKEFYGHKCVLSVRARVWYELVLTEEAASSSLSSSENNNSCIVVLADVEETVFEVLLNFVYTGTVPALDNDEDEEELAKLILLVANRLGVTELKLYAESILVDFFLVPSNAAALLVFADAYTCPFLKEVAMETYRTDSTTFMNAEEDWKKLQESSKLLTELLVYTNKDRRTRYASGVDDIEDLDVTSLRERLQQVNLDVDGSREMLVQRWKDID